MSKSQENSKPETWTYDEPGNWHGISARIVNEKHEPICIIQLAGWGKRRGRKIGAKISATPDLLKACKLLMAVCSGGNMTKKSLEEALACGLEAVRKAETVTR